MLRFALAGFILTSLHLAAVSAQTVTAFEVDRLRAEIQARTPEMDALEIAPNQLAEKLANRRPDEFFYVNTRLSDQACATPLTITEKIDQQAGDSKRELLLQELVLYRDTDLDRWLTRSDWFRPWASKQAFNMPMSILSNHRILIHLVTIFRVRHLALKLEQARFKEITNDDEGDAYRHFIGAFVLTLQLGPELAKAVIDTNEKDDVSMSSLMDRYNNIIGQAAAVEFMQKGQAQIADKDVANLALFNLKSRKLAVIHPRGDFFKEPVWPEGFVPWANQLTNHLMY
jgi:hypothetical protein